MKSLLTALACLVLPNFVLRPFLRFLGHRIGKGARFGFSLIKCPSLDLGPKARIGHLNLITVDSLKLGESGVIGYLNVLKGPFRVELKEHAAIGNKNYISRASPGVVYGSATLTLGKWTKVTTGHHLDLTRSITFGEYSILAGIRSQMWTHGYYHADEGKDRVRIDGSIRVGNNVYIGSGCIFNPGVSVGRAIHIGGGTVIAKDLETPGMYVGQGLRFLKNDIATIREKLTPVEGHDLVEEVVTKERNEAP